MIDFTILFYILHLVAANNIDIILKDGTLRCDKNDIVLTNLESVKNYSLIEGREILDLYNFNIANFQACQNLVNEKEMDYSFRFNLLNILRLLEVLNLEDILYVSHYQVLAETTRKFRKKYHCDENLEKNKKVLDFFNKGRLLVFEFFDAVLTLHLKDNYVFNSKKTYPLLTKSSYLIYFDSTIDQKDMFFNEFKNFNLKDLAFLDLIVSYFEMHELLIDSFILDDETLKRIQFLRGLRTLIYMKENIESLPNFEILDNITYLKLEFSPIGTKILENIQFNSNLEHLCMKNACDSDLNQFKLCGIENLKNLISLELRNIVLDCELQKNIFQLENLKRFRINYIGPTNYEETIQIPAKPFYRNFKYKISKTNPSLN